MLTKKPLVKDIRNQSDTYVISSEEDQAFWKPLMKRAEDEDEIPIYTSGLISQGLITISFPSSMSYGEPLLIKRGPGSPFFFLFSFPCMRLT